MMIQINLRLTDPLKLISMQTDRQKEILDAALDLIDQKGIQGLTIKNLSKKIGISEPAIYRHYENKIEILLTILDLFKDSTGRIFEEEIQNDFGAIEKIEHLFSRHFSKFAENPSLISVIFSEEIFRSEPVLIKKIAEVINKNSLILRKIIIFGQKKGEIREDLEASHIAIIIMGSLRLFVKQWQFSGYNFNLKNEGQRLIDSIKLLIVK
jgi:TetR/AcrR family transcriptional regulator, fatty acid metabolism regulator protein